MKILESMQLKKLNARHPESPSTRSRKVTGPVQARFWPEWADQRSSRGEGPCALIAQFNGACIKIILAILMVLTMASSLSAQQPQTNADQIFLNGAIYVGGSAAANVKAAPKAIAVS